jgi:large subunit ribosomal protein L4
MAVLKVVDQKNTQVGEIDLNSDVFEVEIKPEILNLVVRAHRMKERSGTHSTKTRAYVSGGGAKPWRQKGTGRARAGSNRSNIWRGGAIVFGPLPRTYSIKVNKKVAKLAMRMALSSKVAAEELTVVDKFEMPRIKTKDFKAVVEACGIKKALIVCGKEDNNLSLSARNLPHVKMITSDKLTVYDILKYPQLVMDKDAVAAVVERFNA